MKVLILIVAAFTVVSVYFYFTIAPADAPFYTPVLPLDEIIDTPIPTTSAPAQIAVFENTDYDFTFRFRIKPYGYSVFENTLDQNIDIGTLFGATFMRSNDYNESVKAAAAGNAIDGLPSMSVYVYSASKVLDLEAWLASNKKITNCVEGEITATELAGQDASVCLWEGIYPGTTIAQISDNKIYVLIGTRESAETLDGYSYEKDFNELVESFELIH